MVSFGAEKTFFPCRQGKYDGANTGRSSAELQSTAAPSPPSATGSGSSRKEGLKTCRAARDRDGTRARHLDEAKGLHQRDEGVELFARPGHLEDEAFGRRIDDSGPKDVGETERLDARLAFAHDLDQRHLALDKGSLVGQIVDPVDRNEPRQLRLDLLD